MLPSPNVQQLKHLLFWGDLDISIAESSDLLHFQNTNKTLIARRSTHFDSTLVESGPEPLQLQDGNWLFLYNSAQVVNISNPKPNWNLQYNVGYVILDKLDPTKVLYRSEVPLFSPVLNWETCDNTSGRWATQGLTPLVVFVEGWVQVDANRFLVVYQGCDSVTGLFELQVAW